MTKIIIDLDYQVRIQRQISDAYSQIETLQKSLTKDNFRSTEIKVKNLRAHIETLYERLYPKSEFQLEYPNWVQF